MAASKYTCKKEHAPSRHVMWHDRGLIPTITPITKQLQKGVSFATITVLNPIMTPTVIAILW